MQNFLKRQDLKERLNNGYEEKSITYGYIDRGFSFADSLLLLFNGGEGSAEIKDNEIIITSSNEGTEEYSVQLVQPQMPMEKGASYEFSFEAYADEPRTIKPAITAPDVDWIRYFPDTPVDLTSDWQTFTFDVEMKDESDDNGRVEFNMGKQGSTATVHIRNVKLTRK